MDEENFTWSGHISKLNTQVRRLISDWRSEKETRRRRNKGIDEQIEKLKDDFNKRIKQLEDDKITRDATLRTIKVIILVLWAVIVVLVAYIIKSIHK